MYCEKKEKYRIAFSTREKADYFIEHYEQFMGGNIEFKPIRSFYCNSCDRWHITHLPLTDRYMHVEETNSRVQELQTLALRLKTEFRSADWAVWKFAVGEGLALLEQFKNREGFEKLIQGTGKQIEHFSKLIETAEAKENGAASEQFKTLRKTIEKSAKSLEFYEFYMNVNNMLSQFDNEAVQKAIAPSYREWFKQLERYASMEETMDTARTFMELASESVADSREISSDELYEQVLTMTLCLDRLFVYGLPSSIMEELQKKAKKIENVLENSFRELESPDGFKLIEKIRLIANEKMLREVFECSADEESELAWRMLQYIDGRMGSLPLSEKKVKLMEVLCRLTRRIMPE